MNGNNRYKDVINYVHHYKYRARILINRMPVDYRKVGKKNGNIKFDYLGRNRKRKRLNKFNLLSQTYTIFGFAIWDLFDKLEDILYIKYYSSYTTSILENFIELNQINKKSKREVKGVIDTIDIYNLKQMVDFKFNEFWEGLEEIIEIEINKQLTNGNK